MRAVGYCRVSTADQATEGVSLDNQEAKIRAYAGLNSLDLQEIIRDEGLSGKTLERAGMVRLLSMVEASQIEAVVTYKLDRLSRKTIDNLRLIELFESKGIAFHSITERIDTKSATGRFFLTILSAQAQMERDLIAERTRDALAHKKKQGEWVGRIPHGFKIQGKCLEADPEQLRTIQKAKRLRRNGKTLAAISQAVNLPKSAVHRLVNTNLKTLKANYINGLAA